jgi:hypothetical protein
METAFVTCLLPLGPRLEQKVLCLVERINCAHVQVSLPAMKRRNAGKNIAKARLTKPSPEANTPPEDDQPEPEAASPPEGDQSAPADPPAPLGDDAGLNDFDLIAKKFRSTGDGNPDDPALKAAMEKSVQRLMSSPKRPISTGIPFSSTT